jgi:hypothetical protein
MNPEFSIDPAKFNLKEFGDLLKQPIIEPPLPMDSE